MPGNKSQLAIYANNYPLNPVSNKTKQKTNRCTSSPRLIEKGYNLNNTSTLSNSHILDKPMILNN
jgi:fructose 1,6-bisphosphatase